MNPNAAIERACLLISQNRFQMAQDLLRQALVQEPNSAKAHAYLALCLAQNRDQLKEATRVAEQAVFLAPDDPFSHYVLASVWEDRNQIDKALSSVNESISLDPTNPAAYALKAQLLGKQKNWRAALESAEEGLKIDPDDESCGALRSLALERLGKVQDSRLQAEESRRQNPDSTWAHSSHGWAMLNQGDYRAAQQSFAEALRLSPTNELARSGMIQALNSSNFLYRWIYQVMIKMSRLSSRFQWLLIIGLWLGIRFLNQLGKNNPALLPWILPITLTYLLLAVMSWIMQPLFNTMLRFHPFGKYLLSTKEKWASNLIAGVLAFAIIFALFMGWLADTRMIMIVPIVTGIFLTIPIVVPFNCEAPWAIAVATVVAVLFGVIFLILNGALLFNQFLESIYLMYIFGIIIYCFVGQILMRAQRVV